MYVASMSQLKNHIKTKSSCCLQMRLDGWGLNFPVHIPFQRSSACHKVAASGLSGCLDAGPRLDLLDYTKAGKNPRLDFMGFSGKLCNSLKLHGWMKLTVNVWSESKLPQFNYNSTLLQSIKNSISFSTNHYIHMIQKVNSITHILVTHCQEPQKKWKALFKVQVFKNHSFHSLQY